VADGKHRQLPIAALGRPAREYWRSLAELAGAKVAEETEFAEGADFPPSVSRRAWMKLLGASMALAGVAGCERQRGEKILPYTHTPRHVTPGVPRYYATSLSLDGFATGVLVESHDGRPTKVEGNPDHPASLGATTAIDQATVLGVYDPDRARAPRVPAGPATWQAFFVRFAGERADRGAGLRFLLEPSGSPLLGELVSRVRARFPAARFTFHGAASPSFAAEGGRLAFGVPVQPQYDFRRADVVLALDDDFLAAGPFSVAHARQWAERRRPSSPSASMSRLYVVETMLTPTGSVADHRLRRKPSAVVHVAARVAAEIAAGPGALGKRLPAPVLAALARFREGAVDPVIPALARDLVLRAGASVVTVGRGQPPVVHALGHLVNAMLGNAETAWTIAPTLVGAGDAEQDLGALAAELDRGAVDTVVIVGGNPVYSAPADHELGRRLARVKDVLYLGEYEDETAAVAGWFHPAAHVLETWADATAHDGTTSIVQPLLEPMYGGRTAAQILALFTGRDYPDAHRLLRERWERQLAGGDLEARWAAALQTGLFAGSASKRQHTEIAPPALIAALAALPVTPPASGGLEAAFALDPNVHDGRFTNNPWLLEHPQPITHLTWDNAAQLSPSTARRLDLADEDVVLLELGGRRVRAPVLVVPGHADDAVTLYLGWGRTGSESLARDVGFDANALRTARAPWFAPGLSITKVRGERYPLARTQLHNSVEGRPIALSATLARYREDPGFTSEQRGPVPSLLPPVSTAGEQWAMTIDMSICTGCSACVVACQAENNILVVGKPQVLNSREMHWIRIDSYFHGDPEAPRVVHEPMLCQHCERAPCEYVCPVNATVHSPDGLNEMVYNRCVGTRFCSNNCPYKVRRFNWFDWNKREPANQGPVLLQRNPDVTVRQRGVMEKCTYCVQRIREVEIHARVEDRAIRPGEVVTACQQACPTGAIQFGSLRHTETTMVRWREEPRSLQVLHELGTSPRTMYLARIDNPNPEIE
jgi:MoCo/4Fe-4S cofactor protein with predicted Tat translocation signal